MRLVSANLNGVRAASRRGGVAWLDAAAPDVVCLQEVRANDEQLDSALAGSDVGELERVHAPSAFPGRSGVAILSRFEPGAVRIAPGPLSGPEFADAGRWVEADLVGSSGPFTVVSVYVPKGEVDTEKQETKYRFLTSMGERLGELASFSRPVFVAGDFNVAHERVDLKHWRSNQGRSGFLEAERAHLSDWLANGWTDLGRSLVGPDVPGPYTWWTWRGQAFNNDAGWRIDYVLGNPAGAAAARTYRVGRAATYEQRWSDHAPLLVDLDA